MGHKVRFSQKFEASVGSGHSRYDIELEEGTLGTLVGYDAAGDSISVHVKESSGRERSYTISLEQAYEKLEVSSLGQYLPLDKEEEVRKAAFFDFFPKTVLDTDRVQWGALALLMGKDVIFYGPPGGGKSNVAKDVIKIAQQQDVIFKVEDCKVQCSPFSLFDEEFVREHDHDACPECKIRYDPNFKKTGIFKRPAAKDVKVVVARYGEGQGIEFTEGTVALSRQHLAGFKLPKLDGTTSEGMESEYDPEGYHPGVLPRTNNGILHMDEMDKLRTPALDGLLEAANSERIKPDQLRYSYPAHGFIIGTANDQSKFSGALNDRMALIAIRYPDDLDTSHLITRIGYHKEHVPIDAVSIGDTHKEKGNGLRKIPMPIIIQNAVDSVFQKYRQEFNTDANSEITGSNRSKFDALDAARAKLILDQLFYKDTPSIASTAYAIAGIQYAFCTRVQGKGKGDQKAKTQMRDWVKSNFHDELKQAADVWWCDTYKKIAVAEKIIPEIKENFLKELESYQEAPRNAIDPFEKVKKAYDNESDSEAQKAKVEYPFIDHLFQEQSQFAHIDNTQLIEMVYYFMRSRRHSDCKA